MLYLQSEFVLNVCVLGHFPWLSSILDSLSQFSTNRPNDRAANGQVWKAVPYWDVSKNIYMVHLTLQLKVSPILMHLRKYYPRKRIWHPARARYRSGEILVNNHLSGNTNGVPECSMVKFQTTGKFFFLLWIVFIIMKNIPADF